MSAFDNYLRNLDNYPRNRDLPAPLETRAEFWARKRDDAHNANRYGKVNV